MPKKNLDDLLAEQDTFDDDSKVLLRSLSFAKSELQDLHSMKQTQGWKLLDKKIREQLQSRINLLVKDDAEIITLLALLKVADTKTLGAILNAEIQKILPED